MRYRICLILLVSTCFYTPVQAEVFKCIVNGKTVFKSSAGEGCDSHDLKVAKPSDAEIAARRSELERALADDQARMERQRREDEQARAQNSDMDRMLRLQRQQINMQRQQLEEQRRANQPVIIQDPFQEENQAKNPNRRYFQPLETP